MRVPRALRRLTDPVLERTPVPVLGGPNRGRWWNLASAGSGYGSGRRAAGQLRLFMDLVEPGQVVWDVGAHHGYVTLALSRQVGTAGAVHAFEPGPRNRRMLLRHLKWNDAGNVTVHDCALGATDGTVRFGGRSTSRTQAIGAGDDVVQVRTVATMIRGGAPPPDFVKIDVEDAEADLLEGAGDALPRQACIIIGVHSRRSDERCTGILAAAGFRCYASPALGTARAGDWMGDPDLFCIGPAVGEARARRMTACIEAAGFTAAAA
jgi:FkbM family methyltransferase